MFAPKRAKAGFSLPAARLLYRPWKLTHHIELLGRPVEEPLIKLASKHTDDMLTAMSVRALGDIGDDRAVEPLIAILEYESTIDCAHLRLDTCWALGKIRDARAIESLLRILKNPRNNTFGLEDAAASALVQLDDDRIELPLLKYFRGKLDSMINSRNSAQDEQHGILEGITKLIARLIDKT